MKLLTLILILSSCVTYGQWYIGGKAAAVFSNYKSKTQWTEAANGGYAAGLNAFRQINHRLGLNIELGYIRKGYYHKVSNTITDRLNTDFLEIPLMADYSFDIPSLKNFKAHVNIGVYGAYWLSGKYKTRGFDIGTEDFNFKKNRASHFDFGPNAGARIEYVLMNGSLFLDFRFEKGLVDMEKKTNDDTSNTNQSVIIGISYVKLMGVL